MSASPRMAATDEELLSHMKATNSAKLTSLVNMHLSFLLDLPGSALAELLDGEDRTQTGAAVDKSAISLFRRRPGKGQLLAHPNKKKIV